MDCAKHIVAEGIARVVYHLNIDQLHMSINHSKVSRVFKIAGISFEQLELDEECA